MSIHPFYLQFLKVAGPKEQKRAKGLNWDSIQTKLQKEKPGQAISREEIIEMEKDPANWFVTEQQLALINSLEFKPELRKRLSQDEASFIIIGSVISSNSEAEARQNMELVSNYIELVEAQPNSLSQYLDFSNIKTKFNELLNFIRIENQKIEKEREESADDQYLTHITEHEFKYSKDGWQVVYVPAAGEVIGGVKMKEYPGLPGTSYDRILEGNKNGTCLGTSTRYYQDNEQGKIYSMRSPDNEPAATIRIQNKELLECKGPGNSTPNVETAAHCKRWFESISDLKYKDNYDYRKFPPLSREEVESKFNKSRDSAYNEKWIAYWYKKGIPKLDQDVLERVRNNDFWILISGLALKQNELVRPVAEYWCQKYLEGKLDQDYLALSEMFGESQLYKIYKKLPIMQKAVENKSKEEPLWFLSKKIYKIPEYEKFSESVARELVVKESLDGILEVGEQSWIQTYLDMDLVASKAANEKPLFILRNAEQSWAKPYLEQAVKKVTVGQLFEYADEPWAKPYVEQVAQKLLDEDPLRLYYYANKPWAEPYVDLAAKKLLDEDPAKLLLYYTDQPWAQPYVEQAAQKLLEKDPRWLLRYADKPWAQPYVEQAAQKLLEEDPVRLLDNADQPWAEPYREQAAQKLLEKDPVWILCNVDKPWAQPYIERATKKLIDIQPVKFLNYAHKPWAEPYVDLAAQKLLEEDPVRLLDNADKPWAEPYREQAAQKLLEEDPVGILYNADEPWAEPYVDLAAKKLMDENPAKLLLYYAHKPWAEDYIDSAAQKLLEKDPDMFLYCAHKPWAQPYLPLAREALEKKKKQASSKQQKLISLANLLNKNNFTSEAAQVLKLFREYF